MAEPETVKVEGVEAKPPGTSPTSGLIQTLEGGVLTKRSSRIASRKDLAEGCHMSDTVVACSYMYNALGTRGQPYIMVAL